MIVMPVMLARRASWLLLLLLLFSGRVQVNWHWHEVRDYLPLGAIRSFGKRYSHHKLFTADCDVMRQRLF